MKDLEFYFKSLANPEKARILARFFKTAPGEYGHGDIFLGITVPIIRENIKKYYNLSLKELEQKIKSKYHEVRLAVLLILVYKFSKSDSATQKNIYNLYLNNTNYINNWDLVDLSAPKIVGNFLLNQDKKILYKLVKSKDMWERRITVLATFAFIRNNEFDHTLEICKILLNDKHDLIHKATGWMLREIGKRDCNLLINFLNEYYLVMPRVELRYAIEKLSSEKRSYYLGKK